VGTAARHRRAAAALGTPVSRISLAGAQAKTALLRSGDRWGVPQGSIPTSHILKPAIAGLDDHDLNEHLCLDAARRAGLSAVRTAVWRFGDETAVVVTRYDRLTRDGETVRVHQEDICQALSVPPDRKYERDGGPALSRPRRCFARQWRAKRHSAPCANSRTR
jgi:serine/threonine-protein kinase HipA